MKKENLKIVFATNNKNKAIEIQSIMPEGIEIMTLEDIGCIEDIPETENTLEGNAILKAKYVVEKYGYSCFADDTGLEIDALNGEPGVLSARYAGSNRDSNENIELVLSKLHANTNRTAQFRTVIALYWQNEMHTFEGRVSGNIISEKKGTNGFGYDPIFIPENTGKTFAEMELHEKNNFSHRARAFEKMIDFIHNALK
jgi:XTP/dITP diphosphohydrolase